MSSVLQELTEKCKNKKAIVRTDLRSHNRFFFHCFHFCTIRITYPKGVWSIRNKLKIGKETVALVYKKIHLNEALQGFVGPNEILIL